MQTSERGSLEVVEAAQVFIAKGHLPVVTGEAVLAYRQRTEAQNTINLAFVIPLIFCISASAAATI